MMIGLLIAATATGEVTAPKVSKPDDKVFYIYTEQGSRLNHFIPSGYMGDYGDIKMSLGWKDNPGKGTTCTRVIYSGERKQEAGWAGVFYQYPVNNWGDKKQGYDLSSYKRLRFMARGDKGGEYIDKFQIGGIKGGTEEGDTTESYTDAIELTADWKEYEIDLKGEDLSHIIGGFCFVLNVDSNQKGATFFLDEIRLEK